jgi:hypothetical protein
MSVPWYVWLVGRYAPHVQDGERGEWEIVGVFSTHDRATAAALRGDFILTLALDDVIPPMELGTEWVS